MEDQAPNLIRVSDGKQAATRLAQIAPGCYVPRSIDPADLPRYGYFRLMRQRDGSYLPILKHWGQWRRLDDDLWRHLGLQGLSKRTFLRLCNAGFIRRIRPSPKVILVDLGSLCDHLSAAEDPEFWTPERIRQFQNASPCQDGISKA